MYSLNARFWPSCDLADLQFYLFAGPDAAGAKDKAAGADAVLDGVATHRAILGKVALIFVFEGDTIV